MSRRAHIIRQSQDLPLFNLPLDDLESMIWIFVWRLLFLAEEGIAPESASAAPRTGRNDAKRKKRRQKAGKRELHGKCVRDVDEDTSSDKDSFEYSQDENDADDEEEDGEGQQATPVPTREPLWWAGLNDPDPLVVFNTKVEIAFFFAHHPRYSLPTTSARITLTPTPVLKITPHTKRFVPLIADLFSCINMCFDETRDLRDPETSALAAFDSRLDPDLATIDTRRAELLASADKRASAKRPKTPAEETLDAHMMVLYMRFVGHLWRYLELFKTMEAQAVERRRRGGMKRMDFGCESEESRE